MTATGSETDAADERPRLVFLINSMEGGGAERAMANLLGFLKGRLERYRTEIVLLDTLPIVQDLPSDIPVFQLNGAGGMLTSAVQLLRHFRKRPADICISYLSRANCLNVLAGRLFGHRVIISERVQTTGHLAKSRLRAVYRKMITAAYPRADVTIAVSQGVAEDLVRNYRVPRARIRVIGNPIDAKALHGAAKAPAPVSLPEDYAIAAGRLVPNKNFPMLIRAYANRPRPYDLVILGEGPLRDELQRSSRSLGVEARVHFPGFVQNPYPCIRGARFFVSASSAEGFPNALIEAMVLERPVISTDCPSGPYEILAGTRGQIGRDPLRSAQHGMLVPVGDADALADALDAMEQPETAKDFAARAGARSRDYQIEKVLRDYLDIIENVNGTGE